MKMNCFKMHIHLFVHILDSAVEGGVKAKPVPVTGAW